MKTKVIAFDVFGTVFDLSQVDRAEVRDYAAQLKSAELNGFAPLNLPASWANMPAHPDSVAGIASLREKYIVVTLSNGPLPLQIAMAKNAGIEWDAIIPLEAARVYKPQPGAYKFACDMLRVDPSEVLMVTANEKFGDLEASRALGMQAVLIRGKDGPHSIIDLALHLEASA